MKKLCRSGFMGALAVVAATPVFAASAAREDNSMLLVYLFLGVCGLIIILQLLPVFSLGIGMVKSFFSHKERPQHH